MLNLKKNIYIKIDKLLIKKNIRAIEAHTKCVCNFGDKQFLFLK